MSLELVKGRLYSCKSVCISFLSRDLLCLYREHPTLVRIFSFFFVSPLGTGKVLLYSLCSASGRGVNRTSCESPVYTIISPGVVRKESKGPRHISSLLPCFFFFSPLPHLFSLHELLFPIHKHIAVELYGHAWNMINKISSPNTSLFNCSLKQSTHSHFSVPCFLYFLHLHLLPSPFLHIQNAFGRFSFSLPYLFRDNMGRRRTTCRKMNRRILHL